MLYNTCVFCDLGRDLLRLTVSLDEPSSWISDVVSSRATWSKGAFDNDGQQDAHDAFCRLFDECAGVDYHMLYALPFPPEVLSGLERNSRENGDRYSTPFWCACGGVMKSTTKCLACLSTSPKYDMWHSLSLALPATPCSAEALLAAHWGVKHLSDPADRCAHEQCGVLNRRVLETELVTWPAVLVIHLKRWRVLSQYPFVQEKVPTHVDYEAMFVPAPGVPAYHLRGVIEHHGEAGAGHYTSVVRAPDNYWYECDDEVSPRRIPTHRALHREAMMLFYDH